MEFAFESTRRAYLPCGCMGNGRVALRPLFCGSFFRYVGQMLTWLGSAAL